MTDTTADTGILAKIPSMVNQALTSEERDELASGIATELGVSDGSALRFVITSIGVAATTDPDQLQATHDAVIKSALDAKEKWAVEVTSALAYAAMRPTYDKAKEKGARTGEIVGVLMVEHGLSRTEARNVIKHFDALATDSGGDVESKPADDDKDQSTEES